MTPGYEWAQNYYLGYDPLYVREKGGLSTGRKIFFLDALDHYARIRPDSDTPIRVIDIGCGIWTRELAAEISSWGRDNHRKVHATTVDPAFNENIALQDYNFTNLEVCHSTTTFSDWLKARSDEDPPFDLIFSFNGLASPLQDEVRERSEEVPNHLHVRAIVGDWLQRLLERRYGAFHLYHGSRFSDERQAKFDEQAASQIFGPNRPDLDFDQISAEDVRDGLLGHFPLTESEEVVPFRVPSNDRECAAFGRYFFRTNELDDDCVHWLNAYLEHLRQLADERSAVVTIHPNEPHVAAIFNRMVIAATGRAAELWDCPTSAPVFRAGGERPLREEVEPFKDSLRSIYRGSDSLTYLSALFKPAPSMNGAESIRSYFSDREVERMQQFGRSSEIPDSSCVAAAAMYPLFLNDELARGTLFANPDAQMQIIPVGSAEDAAYLQFALTTDLMIKDQLANGDEAMSTVQALIKEDELRSTREKLDEHRDSVRTFWKEWSKIPDPFEALQDPQRHNQVPAFPAREIASALEGPADAVVSNEDWATFCEAFRLEPPLSTVDKARKYVFLRQLMYSQKIVLWVYPHWSDFVERTTSLFFGIFEMTGDDPVADIRATMKAVREVAAGYEDYLRMRVLRESEAKSVRAAIMSRNFSHVDGSHVLASPRLAHSLGIDPGAPRKRLSTLMNFFQARLDYIARAIGMSAGTPEPLFLVKDLLGGLLAQTTLLDNIIADIGPTVERDQISVRWHNQDGEWTHTAVPGEDFPADAETDRDYEGVPSSFDWMAKTDSGQRREAPEDYLVAVPGGTIGAQAMYAFLENIVRNSAKYGSSDRARDDGYILHIRCWRDEDRTTTVTFWDNLSEIDRDTEEGEDAFESIRKALFDPLVGDDPLQGHQKAMGLKEVRICADFLAGTQGSKIEPRLVDECGDGVERKGFLAYDLNFECPRLLVYNGRRGVVVGDFVRRSSTVDEMARENAYMASIIDYSAYFETRADETEEIIDAISRNHRQLPYRLMIVTVPDKVQAWQERIDAAAPQWEEDRNNWKPGWIPPRRVRVVGIENLPSVLTSGTGNQAEGFLGCFDWEAWILRLYDEWVRASKPPPPSSPQWNLCISLERGPNEHEDGLWDEPLRKFRETGPSVADIRLLTGDEDERIDVIDALLRERRAAKSEQDSPAAARESSSYLVFENHGKLLEDTNYLGYEEWPRFHQEFGSNTPRLFQTLSNPPQDEFSFAFFVYQLVESCLTNVVVVDERVALAATNPRHGLYSNLSREFQRAGIFTTYSMTPNGLDPWYLAAELADLAKREGANRVSDMDGLRFAPSERRELPASGKPVGLTVHVPSTSDSESPLTPIDFGASADVIVLHEGVSEMLNRQQMKWGIECSDQLFALAPMVVRTSGRGASRRDLASELPFVEFSSVSGNTFQGLSKYHLCKAILSLVGTDG